MSPWCYSAAVPFLLWALGLQLGWYTADESRVAFALIEFVAIVISIHSLRKRYGDRA
jgi:acid phosphatase family membrane protein YuiD